MKSTTKKLNTIIGSDSKIIGDIESQGSVHIDGEIQGNVIAKNLITVGTSAKIAGNIRTVEIVVSGKIEGNIFAKKEIELKNKSVVKGDISTKILTIETGAMLDGKCSMESVEVNKLSDEKSD